MADSDTGCTYVSDELCPLEALWAWKAQHCRSHYEAPFRPPQGEGCSLPFATRQKDVMAFRVNADQ